MRAHTHTRASQQALPWSEQQARVQRSVGRVSSTSRYRVRQWTGDEHEAQQIKVLWQQGLLNKGLVRSYGSSASNPAQLGSEATSRMLRFHERKHAATAAARQLRAQAAAAQEDRERKRLLVEAQRLRRQRMFSVLVAEFCSLEGRSLAAYCLVSISQPLALLPPPFPSTSPLLMNIDALAVAEEHRRCGVATQLLQAVEILARRWGRRSIWLSVDPDNAAAIRLYRGQGFVEINEPVWIRLLRQKRDIFMHKRVPPYPEGARGCYLRGRGSESGESRESVLRAEGELVGNDSAGSSMDGMDGSLADVQSTTEFARGATEKRKVYNWGEE